MEPTLLVPEAAEHLAAVRHIFSSLLTPTLIPGKNSTTLSTSPPSKFSQFEFVKRWNLNAFAADADERPVIMFHAGTPFALFDLYNALFSVGKLLPQYEGSAESALVPKTAFLSDDYSRLAEQRTLPAEDQRQPLAYINIYSAPTMPRSDLRRNMARNAYFDAIFFLFAHELGHIDCGHLELLRRRYNLLCLAEINAATETAATPIDAVVLQALEIQADSYAISRQILKYLPTDNPYMQHAQEMGTGRSLEEGERYQLWLVTVGILFLFLEHLNLRASNGPWWPFKIQPDHPASLVRFRGTIEGASQICHKRGAT